MTAPGMVLPAAKDVRDMLTGLVGKDVGVAPGGPVTPTPEKPDLVLSDWNMPNMTGIECLQALRSSGSDVPFGFVTSEGSPEMREKAATAGALFLIAKPFTEDTFRDTLGAVVA